MINIDDMNIKQLIIYFRKMSLEEIVFNVVQIKNLDLEKFGLLFLNVNNDIKKYILDDKELFNKVMSISQNRNKRLVIEIVDDKIRDYILRHGNLRRSKIGKECVLKYLVKLNYNKFTRIMNEYNLGYLKSEINMMLELDKYGMLEYADKYIKDRNFNPVYLIKIKNGYEFFIYEKFNVLVNIQRVVDDKIFFDDNVFIDYKFLVYVNKRHITRLIKILSKKDCEYDNNQLFVSVIKLYMIFGYDDSKKIVEDFYTFSTDYSLSRASFELFRDNRRAFRLENQEKYYYFGIEKDCIDAVFKNDRSIFKNICLKTDDDSIDFFMSKIKNAMDGLSELEIIEAIRKVIVDEINYRENYYQEIDIEFYKEYYRKNAREYGVSVLELYEMFKYIDIVSDLDEKGHVIKNGELIKFLLGNCKRDNDCLLRLVFNKQALGLNREIYNIINNFDKVKRCISENADLSLYSLLDVIDISKTFLYDLKPDELDITLETLSKILNSRKYLKESPEEIVKRVLELHKLRKRKIWSSIPIIKGCIDGNKYEIVDFDDQSLLTSGIDGGDCLKVGGEGEEFLRYCLTNNNGALMYLYYNNVKYILPCSRNGNMVNINSIDPRINNINDAMGILSFLESVVSLWVDSDSNGIELVTITDIHMEDYIRCKNYREIKFDYSIPLNEYVYTDYNKKDVTNFIIASRDNATVSYDFVDERYYQDRNVPYIYIPDHDVDTERIEIFINNVCYSCIDFLNCSDIEKKVQRDNYDLLKVSDFSYIVGNKDWFIGIDNNYNIQYYVLPYDDRVLEEFDYYKDKIFDTISDVKVYVKNKD